MNHEVRLVQGSVEYLYADIRADRILDTQAVALSISPNDAPSAWVPAVWQGHPGKYRAARVLLDGTLARGLYNVYARITDSPEAPILIVGRLKII